MHLKSTAIAFALCFALASFSDASAARIVNLSGKPHDFHLTIAGKEQVIHLDAAAWWETQLYPVIAYMGDHRLELDPDTEYAYWPDGTLGPQFRGPHSRGGNF